MVSCNLDLTFNGLHPMNMFRMLRYSTLKNHFGYIWKNGQYFWIVFHQFKLIIVCSFYSHSLKYLYLYTIHHVLSILEKELSTANYLMFFIRTYYSLIGSWPRTFFNKIGVSCRSTSWLNFKSCSWEYFERLCFAHEPIIRSSYLTPKLFDRNIIWLLRALVYF